MCAANVILCNRNFPSLWVPNQLVADVLHAVCAVAPVRGGRFVAPRHMLFVKITF